MKGADHAHVANHRQAAPERQRADIHVRLAQVMRRHGPDQLIDEWMFAGVDGCFFPERAIRSFDRGPAAAQAARPRKRKKTICVGFSTVSSVNQYPRAMYSSRVKNIVLPSTTASKRGRVASLCAMHGMMTSESRR